MLFHLPSLLSLTPSLTPQLIENFSSPIAYEVIIVALQAEIRDLKVGRGGGELGGEGRAGVVKCL